VETGAGAIAVLSGPELEIQAGTETGLIFDQHRIIGFDKSGAAVSHGTGRVAQRQATRP
jgi:hypothetical protein